jgi:hypothetical protein
MLQADNNILLCESETILVLECVSSYIIMEMRIVSFSICIANLLGQWAKMQNMWLEVTKV